MRRLNLFMFLAAFLSPSTILIGFAQDVLTLDATKQQIMRPPRGRGPFPGSPTPGHSEGLPIRLELHFPTRQVASERSVFVDFLITNVGAASIELPCSVVLLENPNVGGAAILSLWITSDAIADQYAIDVQTGRLFKIPAVDISAELDGDTNGPTSFCKLEPSESLNVRAQAPVLKMGTHSFTAHAELIKVSPRLYLNSDSSSSGIRRPETADSNPIKTTLSIARSVPSPAPKQFR